MIKKREKISFYTHCATAIASIAGTVLLVLKSADIPYFGTASVIYGSSVSFLFIASSIYHFRKKIENDNSLWRKLDHFAIFVMIAGTYTPIAFAYLQGKIMVTVLAIQWGLVFSGAVFKFIYLKAPRIFSTIIYLLMGWMAMLILKYLLVTMPLSQFFFILGGGLAFTAGAILYMLKKPVIIPGFFGFHELFHIFIILGAAFHYTVVFRALVRA